MAKITSKRLRAWLDVSLWVSLQTSDADFRLSVLAGKGVMEVPPDIFEVFRRYGLVIENKGRYFLESKPFELPLLVELLVKG